MTLTILALEHFKGKSYIGCDAGLNELPFDVIGFEKSLETNNLLKILAKFGFWKHVKKLLMQSLPD